MNTIDPEANTQNSFDTSGWRERLRRAQFEDEAGFAMGTPVLDLLKERCERVERACIAAFEHVFPEVRGVALIATGGFGRGELFPQSDVDLMFLIENHQDLRLKNGVEKLLGLLWNIGLQASHVTRTVVQCAEEAAIDLSSATALFEARRLGGDSALTEAMLSVIQPERMWDSLTFLKAKREELRTRHAKFNDTAFNLEPNVKEGPGGLRDLHALIWVAGRAFGVPRMRDWAQHGLCSDADQRRLIEAQELLSTVRFGLHRTTQRREERLLFDHQRALARMFEPALGERENVVVERFMQTFFRAVGSVRRVGERLWAGWQDRLDGSADAAQADLDNGFFARAQRLGYAGVAPDAQRSMAAFELLLQQPDLIALEPGFEAAIASLCVESDGTIWREPQIAESLLRILRHPGDVMKVIGRMVDCGVLGRILPAFERVTGRMQYDMFHVYTVDQHTLFVMHKLRSFADPARASTHTLAFEIYARLRKPELLLLSGLFHDIAKGRGGDHSELGEADAREFCQWLGLPEMDVDLVAWLVRQHLTMSVTAQKKDISDPEVVHRFAALVEDWERLDYLYLLTVADIFATSPKLWNSWKGQLLATLHLATRYALRRGLEHPVHARERILEAQFGALTTLAQTGYDAARVRALWAEYPDENFLRFTPGQLAWQTAAILDHGDSTAPLVTARAAGERGGTEVFVFSVDRDGLFATITAVLDRFQLSVQEARIATSRQGQVLDAFQVLDAEQKQVSDPERMQELVERLRAELLKPELNLTPARRAWTRQQKHFHVPLRLEFQSDEKRGRTGLALVCSDRPGLLAHVTQAFRACGIRVHDARIATFGERVEDFFELTDERDQKLDDVQIRALRATLTHELEVPRR
ncbi:MAG: [protein-PII] uridylyltransferase [Pseudomonadota bacterium]|nr:[protein-PII] uridylyltransferase [Pseudomonadota bacterium]